MLRTANGVKWHQVGVHEDGRELWVHSDHPELEVPVRSSHNPAYLPFSHDPVGIFSQGEAGGIANVFDGVIHLLSQDDGDDADDHDAADADVARYRGSARGEGRLLHAKSSGKSLMTQKSRS